MRDIWGAGLMLGAGDVGSGVTGMSGDHETLCDFFDFRDVGERVCFRMDLPCVVGKTGSDVTGGGTGGV